MNISNNPSQIEAKLESTHPPQAAPKPVRPSFVFLAITAIGITAAADFLIYGHRAGLGLALFLPMLWAALAVHRGGRRPTGRDVLLLALLAGASLATAIAPSGANVLVFLILTFFASSHWLADQLTPHWARVLQGLAAFTYLPSTLRNIGRGFDEMFAAARSGQVQRSAGWLVRFCRILVPVAMVCVPFLILLGGGNAILGHAIGDALHWLAGFLFDFEAPTGPRLLFWIGVAAGVFALLGNRPKPVASNGLLSKTTRRPPGDLAVSIWRTRTLLIAVNVMFFAANATDVVFLWGDRSGPPLGVSHSELVHHGTNQLIASVVLAAVVLSFLFNAAPTVTGAFGQRALAGLWVAQNLLLTAGVVLRVNLYVDSYGLSVLRVHLVLFLGLVAVGFVLLWVRIAWRLSLRWLVGANLSAVFALFFVGQFADIRGRVAAHNVRAAAAGSGGGIALDLDYLFELAPESWPALRSVAEDAPTFGDRSTTAARWLADAARAERTAATDEDWRSWNWRRAHLRRTGLRGKEPHRRTSQNLREKRDETRRLGQGEPARRPGRTGATRAATQAPQDI